MVVVKAPSDPFFSQVIRWMFYTLDGLTVLEAAQADLTKNPDWKPVVD